MGWFAQILVEDSDGTQWHVREKDVVSPFKQAEPVGVRMHFYLVNSQTPITHNNLETLLYSSDSFRWGGYTIVVVVSWSEAWTTTTSWRQIPSGNLEACMYIGDLFDVLKIMVCFCLSWSRHNILQKKKKLYTPFNELLVRSIPLKFSVFQFYFHH